MYNRLSLSTIATYSDSTSPCTLLLTCNLSARAAGIYLLSGTHSGT
jgi:hypothetical protein